MFWLASAALFSLPVPADARARDIRDLFSFEDVPVYLLHRENVSLTVYTSTTVRPDGAVESCSVEASSGDAKLDAYTCALIVKRGRLLPARWTDGSAAYGVVRLPVHYYVGSSTPSEKLPDADVLLFVNHLPKGARRIIGLQLQVAADDGGRVVACAELPPLKTDRRKRFPEFVPVACRQVTSALKLVPPKDRSGKPVHSVQNLFVNVSTR
jgi:hypothetical protein